MTPFKGASAGASGSASAHSAREPVALTDQQWAVLAPLVPGAQGTAHGRAAEPQRVVEGILFAIRNGMGMQSVPPPYPSGSTLYRRFSAWTAGGQWEPIWTAFLSTLSPDERRTWEAASRRRPGTTIEPAATPAPAAPAVAAAPAAEAPVEAQAPQSPAATTHSVHARATTPDGGAGVGPDAVVAGMPATDDELAGRATPLSVDAVREHVTGRLGLSRAESEIAGRRIGDHGVHAALTALDEVERRVATGTMRGVGGMPMSAFEIWVCAVGLTRRPVERPRAPRPERNDRHDVERRKRQWRKAS